MTENELALQEFKEKNTKIREIAFDGMRNYLRMTPEHLKGYGHKTPEEAAIFVFKRALEDINKNIAEYLKKYPD